MSEQERNMRLSYCLGNRETIFSSCQMQEFAPFLQSMQTGSGTHPPSYSFGTEGCFSAGQCVHSTGHHLLPSTVKTENAWSFISVPSKPP
jgi:hypothetical protein